MAHIERSIERRIRLRDEFTAREMWYRIGVSVASRAGVFMALIRMVRRGRISIGRNPKRHGQATVFVTD